MRWLDSDLWQACLLTVSNHVSKHYGLLSYVLWLEAVHDCIQYRSTGMRHRPLHHMNQNMVVMDTDLTTFSLIFVSTSSSVAWGPGGMELRHRVGGAPHLAGLVSDALENPLHSRPEQVHVLSHRQALERQAVLDLVRVELIRKSL